MTEAEMEPDVEKLFSLFFPYASKKIREAKDTKIKLAHYTSAEAAVKILRSKELWLRNARIMNDFSEIEHGHECLRSVWPNAESGNKLKKMLEIIEPGLAEKIETTFDEGGDERKYQTSIFSLCEHDENDNVGRLSMWREYGGASNVAMVFKGLAETIRTKATMISLSPVLYADRQIFEDHFANFVKGLEKEIDFLVKISKQNQKLIPALIFSAFTYAINCTKHLSFAEEKEWRVLYSKQFDVFGMDNGASDLIVINSVEIIDGIPQKIAKLQLKDVPQIDFIGATLPNLLERIILGPSANPWIMFEAIYTEMEEAGVGIANQPVKISNIPLRR